MRLLSLRTLFISGSLALSACHSSSSTTTPSPVVSPTPTSSASIPASGGTITTVLANGDSASLTIPASSGGVTVTITSSTTAPAGAGAATGTPILYATITPSASTTFTSGGVVSGSVTIASGLSSSGTYSLELYAPTQGWLVDPTAGTISGNTLTFSYTLPNAITVYGVTYDIAISKTN